MNLLTAQLSHRQAIIVKDIARNQIQTLIKVSSNEGLCVNISAQEKASTISQLLRDFSKLVQFPEHLFNIHQHSKAIFKHELFSVTYGDQEARDTYNIDEYPSDAIKALWRKVTAAQDFNLPQLN